METQIPEDIKTLIEVIYAKKPKIGLAGTGSGGNIFSWLLSVPGCSSTVLTADVPYSMAASREYLAQYTSIDPEETGYCSREVAEGLARGAFLKAAHLKMLEAAADKEVGLEQSIKDLGRHRVIGIGITAGVVSTRPKRGKHRVHVASYTAGRGTTYYYFELSKGDRDRYGEDTMVSRLALRAILEAADIEFPPEFPSAMVLVEEGKETVPDALRVGDGDALAQLYANQADCILQVPVVKPDGTMGAELYSNVTGFPKGTIMFSGSFNPLHPGHWTLLKVAQQVMSESIQDAESETKDDTESKETKEDAESKDEDVGNRPPTPLFPVVYEIAAFNADKPPLTREVVESRLAQFVKEDLDSSDCVVVTKAPMFFQKARLFPNTTFVVGVDTVKRLLDKKNTSTTVRQRCFIL